MPSRWVRLVATIGAAGLPALGYVIYVAHYSVNVPFSDDWSSMAFVANALHGRLAWGQVWAQHSDARLVLPNLILVASGHLDHLDLRALMITSSAIYCATFVVLLRVCRASFDRPLGPIPVLSLGLVWFSLADWGNSLWSFQIAWFLVLLFFALMVYFLLVFSRSRTVGFAVSAVAALAASLSMVQGFLLWPVGVICLLWGVRSARRRRIELTIWLGLALVEAAVYLRGYHQGVGCFPRSADCSLGYIGGHPKLLGSYSLALAGNVVPKLGPWGAHYVGVHQLLGAALVVAAAFVIVQSLREWSGATRPPVALVLVVFALLFELTLAVGRAGEGVASALSNVRFVMPTIVLLAGLVTYAWGKPPRWSTALRSRRWRECAGVATFVVLGVFVMLQGYFNSTYGIVKGRLLHKIEIVDARTVVNFDLIPTNERGCLVSRYAWNGVYPASAKQLLYYPIRRARTAHLSVFAPDSFAKFRAMGPPPQSAACGRRAKAG